MRFMVTGKGIKDPRTNRRHWQGKEESDRSERQSAHGPGEVVSTDRRQSREREKRKGGVFIFHLSLYPEDPLEI